MQYLNDDNMDELFRRAAEDYPLNTDSTNWDKVAAAVQGEQPDSASNSNPAKKKNFRKYLWLLLLLPMIWICNGKFFMNDGTVGENSVALKRPELAKKAVTSENKESQHKYAPVSADQVSAKATAKIIDKLTDGSTDISKKPKEKNNTIDQNNIRQKPDQSLPMSGPTSNPKQKTTIEGLILQGEKIKATTKRSTKLQYPYDDRNDGRQEVRTGSNNKDKTQENTKSNNNLPKDLKPLGEGSANNDVAIQDKTNNGLTQQKSDVADDNVNTGGSSKMTALVKPGKTDSVQQQHFPAAGNKSSSSKIKKHYLYVGLIGGFDASTVEFQSVKNTGYTAGILLGYQLSKKLSIESGFMYDKKFYYTDGKYFNTQKINLYPNWSIEDATGDCYMFELPINIKYNWTSSTKSNWFSTLGLSSYFMKKETYAYTYEYSNQTFYGWPQTYAESTSTWFGVINLSGGYMHTIGKAGSLRVEPYLKIPLQRLGIGSLSIWSTGVYVSFVKTIF